MAYTTINKPADYFNTLLWSGTGASNSLTGVGFQPDWTWIKKRSNIADHRIFDSVRGATKALKSNATQAEGTETQALTSFDSDGFTLGTDDFTNGSGSTFVGWNWLAGGTASSNTDGSITSSVSANTTSGFSIVSYTGTGANATVGHGLGVAPKIMIAKSRSSARGWITYTTVIDGSMDYLYLNLTDAKGDSVASVPTSSIVNLTGGADVNASSENFIMYCFSEVKGFSKFGSFAGNGSNDGTFVYTGFKPAFVITKLSSGIGSWFLHDNKRNGYNGGNNYVYPNAPDAELTTQLLDITSNGFKMRFSGGANSSGTSIYMAFAENPLVTSGGTPATAR